MPAPSPPASQDTGLRGRPVRRTPQPGMRRGGSGHVGDDRRRFGGLYAGAVVALDLGDLLRVRAGVLAARTRAGAGHQRRARPGLAVGQPEDVAELVGDDADRVVTL